MTRTRWHKIIRDLAQRRARTLLTLFGLTLGLVFVGSVVTAFAIIRNDLDANFRLTNPANITVSAGSIPADLSARIAALPGVTGVDERPEFGALIQIRPDRWMPLLITVVSDFQHLFDTIRMLLAGLAVVALIMCAILIINLIDSLMAAEQRAIGVLRALGARSGQIIQDYMFGMGSLGTLAGALSLYPSLWTGKTIARYLTMGLNFNLLSPSGPIWLTPLLLSIGIVIPISVAFSAIVRAAYRPVRQALARGDGGQAFPFADGFGALMTFLPLIPRLGVRSVARKPRKVLLSALILSLGLSFFVTALTIRASMLSTVDSVGRTKSFDLGVGLRAAEPVDQLKAWMKEIPEVRHGEYWSTAEATLHRAGPRFNNPTPIVGIPNDTESIRPDVIAGHWIEAAFPAGIVVNQILLRDEPDLHLGGAYTMVVDGRRGDVTVVGVIQEFNPGRIYCSKSLLDGLLNQERRANAMVLTVDDGSFEAQRHAARKIQTSAIGPDRQISGILLTRTLEMVILGHLDILTGLLMLIGVIALMVGAMGLASTISVSVVERFREIAVLKAIGGRSSTIAGLFATEAVVIALIGWAISVALTPLLSHPVVSVLGSAVIGYKFEYRTSPMGVALALGVAILVALLAAILPIRAAMRLTIRNGLHAE